TSERAALNIVHDALTNYKQWEEEIEKWQSPILRDDRLPEWYKFTLFNELYFLVAGGTVWIDSSLPATSSKNSLHQSAAVENTNVNVTVAKGNSRREKPVIPQESNSHHSIHKDTLKDPQDETDDVGRFLYLEGVEYIMWCTYDVHFYASFALLELFPKIELSIQREFAKAVLSEDGRRVKFLAEGNWGIRKVRGAVPHDLGTHDPWHEMNAYNIHDTSQWKDLNPKFVLQVYRDFAATRDFSFGADVWPAVRAAMEYMEQFDRDSDGLIENDGFPDQTYDTWTVHGISAYCGCLWLAALQAAAAMALQLGDKPFAEKCKSKFFKAKLVFEEKLWNGSYFNYDSGSSSNSKSIQADQLAGQWYTASSGLPSLFDDCKIKSSLHKIYDFNVMKVKGGKMGAVNGMHPNGKVDESCMQSREIWTGVTYGVAATMILSGMEEQAFTTAEGIFTAGWSEEGYGTLDFIDDMHCVVQILNCFVHSGLCVACVVSADYPSVGSCLRHCQHNFLPAWKRSIMFCFGVSKLSFPIVFVSLYYALQLKECLKSSAILVPGNAEERKEEGEVEGKKKSVKGCKGFPMALKVIGKSLCCQSAEAWGCFMDLGSFPEDQKIPATALIDMWAELFKLHRDGVFVINNFQV
ncbi:Non-lysosomal glucosylceramidase, partial [Vitis vinifera]